MIFYLIFNGGAQFLYCAKAAAPDSLLGQITKPTLDQIQRRKPRPQATNTIPTTANISIPEKNLSSDREPSANSGLDIETKNLFGLLEAGEHCFAIIRNCLIISRNRSVGRSPGSSCVEDCFRRRQSHRP